MFAMEAVISIESTSSLAHCLWPPNAALVLRHPLAASDSLRIHFGLRRFLCRVHADDAVWIQFRLALRISSEGKRTASYNLFT